MQTILPFIKQQLSPRRSRFVFLGLALILGVLMLMPSSNFQPFLAQGDHGRDLYAFQKTLEGQIPYRDYWWVYGPLMPYYYALWHWLLGVHIQSVLFGKLFLNLLCGMAVFGAVSVWAAPVMAFLAALWFWAFQQDFFYTYNHAGGALILTAVIYFLFLYIKKPERIYAYGGLCCVFVLTLIKLNIGLSTLAAFMLSVAIRDALGKNTAGQSMRLYGLAPLCLLAATFLVYYLFIKEVPWDFLRHCFPYVQADQYYATAAQAISIYSKFVYSRLASNWASLFLGAVILLSSAQTLYAASRKNADPIVRTQTAALFASFVVFSVFNMHEFLQSGVMYRTFWIESFKIMFVFIVMALAMKCLPASVKLLLYLALGFLLAVQAGAHSASAEQHKNSAHYLPFEHGKIFVGNSPEWIDTVKKTMQFLNANLGDQEKFLAVPYDPLYYYLTGKTSPTPYLIFFDYIHIQPREEEQIIRSIEHNNVEYILLSSRISASEPGLGIFSVTYGLSLAKYIAGHFREIAAFGDWDNDPGWAWNHGTKILKRVRP